MTTRRCNNTIANIDFRTDQENRGDVGAATDSVDGAEHSARCSDSLGVQTWAYSWIWVQVAPPLLPNPLSYRRALADVVFAARRKAATGPTPSALANDMNSSTSMRRAPVSM